MEEENSYEALYLYNAVTEYIYFVIALIEAEGPRSLDNVERHLQFFNHYIYGFVKKFNGENLAEKIGTMLCTTTPVFEVKEKILNLSLNYQHFKGTVYKHLLINKIVDSVLRGMISVRDICHNLNLNNMIKIEERTLTVIVKKCPYFYLDSNDSVIIRQFHGLLGFENHTYKMIVRYFQSYLQNIDLLTYNEVIFHEKYIPSCGISNQLFLFCVLHVCSIFKCENNKVKLRKKFRKKKLGNQVINIEELSISPSESIPIGLLVSKALGKTLYSWTGEISKLTRATGWIQCVVSFSNGYQGIFVIYLYKTALKHICETEDLNDFLGIRDVVEFDAVYCDEAVDQHIFWQATRIKVIKQSLKKSKFELDVDVEMYLEKIKLKVNSFNITSKTCNLRNCKANFLVLEKNLSLSPRKKASAKIPLDLNAKLSSELQNSVFEKSSNFCQDTSDCSIDKTVIVMNQLLSINDRKEDILCNFKNEPVLPAVKKDSNENNVHASDLFFQSLFVFGEISVTSEEDGIAIAMNKLDQFNVFFKSESIFSDKTRKIPTKGSIVLLFIPYFKSEDSFCVATLVYALNSEETILYKDSIGIETFVMNNFLPVVKKNLSDAYPCFCGLSHILTQILLISQKSETKRAKLYKCFSFIKSLQETFCFSNKTSALFCVLINEIYSQNLSFSSAKLCAVLASIFVQAFSFTTCSKKSKVLRKQRKTFNKCIHNRNHSSSHFLSHIKISCSKISDVTIGSFREEINKPLHKKSDIKKENKDVRKDLCLSENADSISYDTTLLQVEPVVDQNQGSCISLSSSKSSNSKSSDDVYYSCESLPDKFDLDSENNIRSQSNSPHLYKDNDCKKAFDYDEMIDAPSLIEKSTDLSCGSKDIPKITVNYLSEISTEKFEFSDYLDFKLRHSSLFKAKIRRNKRRIILPFSSNHCKDCWKPVIETTAHISAITKSCLYFSTEYNQQTATLRFPVNLVSEEVLKSLSLASTIKIGIIPNILLHFSDVLYINLY